MIGHYNFYDVMCKKLSKYNADLQSYFKNKRAQFFAYCTHNCVISLSKWDRSCQMGETTEIVIKFLETRWTIFSAHTDVIKLPSQKMADTSRDELLLGGGIRHVTVRHCIMRTVNKFLLA